MKLLYLRKKNSIRMFTLFVSLRKTTPETVFPNFFYLNVEITFIFIYFFSLFNFNNNNIETFSNDDKIKELFFTFRVFLLNYGFSR